MVQMACNAYISYQGRILHETEHIISGIICLYGLVQIEIFLLFFGNDGSFQSLSILLLDHDLGLRIHFLMSLIVFFILVKYNSMLIRCVGNVNPFSQLLLVVLR
jgi:hypothetical protein